MRRREFISAAAALGLTACALARGQEAPIQRKGRIKQGLWQTNFGQGRNDPGPLTLDDMCWEAARLGAHGFDLIRFTDQPVLDRHGLKILLAGPGEIDFLTGIIHSETYDDIEPKLRAQIDACAEHGVGVFTCNAGERRGLTFAQGADNAVELLSRLAEQLEERDVTMTMENVNFRRPGEPRLGRDDMVFGHWDWGLEVCERVGSPNVKLLCDVYHLQIMDGDVTRRIQDSIDRIAHFHVAGVPTRGEIEDDQELNYRHLARVIADLDYDGYVSHEWRPTPGRDPIESIARAMDIMDV